MKDKYPKENYDTTDMPPGGQAIPLPDYRITRVEQVYNTVEGFTDIYGYPPTLEEIRDRTSISSVSVVNWYLDLLENFGYIIRDRRISRGIRIIK